MATNIGTAYVQIAPATKGLSGAVNKVFAGQGDAAGRAMGDKSGGGFLKSGFAGMVGGAFAAVVTKGIQSVVQNLDAAISRYDTINNFPKVMQNFGISGEDAAAAMDKLQKAIDGLPTSLDSAANGVQAITGVTGDVDKAVDVFDALNNAIIAGGKPMADQASAMEQFNQAFAKGKPDMMEWRALLSVMRPQMNQLATAMGYGADGVMDLGEDLRTGKVPMTDFTDALIQLNKEGIEGFPNFADQADNMVGGIGTAMSRSKTAITRGIANMLLAFDEGAEKNGFPRISEIITSSIGAIDKAFEFFGKIIETAMVAIKKFSESEAGQRMAATVKELGESFKGFGEGAGKVFLKIIEGIFTVFQTAGLIVITIIKAIKDGIEKFANSPGGQKLRETFASISERMQAITGGDGPTLMGFLDGLATVFSVVAQGIGYAITGIMIAVDAVQAAIQWWWENIMIPVATAVITAWQAIVDFFTVTIPGAFQAFKDAVMNIIYSIAEFFIERVQFIVVIWEAIITFFKELPGKIFTALSGLWNKIKEIFTSIPGKVLDAIKDILDVGKALVQGLWDGITAMGDWLKEKISGFASGIINGFKRAFGINSPSKETAWMGRMMGEGLGIGITESLKGVVKDIRPAMNNVLSEFSRGTNIGGINGNMAFDGVSPAEYKQVNVYQNIQTPNTLLDVYNNTKFGVNAAVMV